jgi:hypothetical protein
MSATPTAPPSVTPLRPRQGITKALMREVLDPELALADACERRFRSPRSLRDVAKALEGLSDVVSGDVAAKKRGGDASIDTGATIAYIARNRSSSRVTQ